MAEIDTRIQVPSLLTQIQQAASSAQGLGQNILGGMRLAEGKRQFNEVRNREIEEHNNTQLRMSLIYGRLQVMNKQIKEAGDDDQAVMDILMKNADMAMDPLSQPAFGEMMKLTSLKIGLRNNLITAKQNSIASKMLQESQSQMIKDAENFEPVDRGRFLTMFNESQGAFTPEIEEFYREATKRAPQKPKTEIADIAKIKQWSQYGADIKQAREAGNEELAKTLETEREMLGALIGGTTLRIETTPEGGTIITQGKGQSGGTTLGTQSEVEKRIIGTSNLLEGMSELSDELRSSDVGFRGVIGEKVFDRLLPQLGYKTADLQRVDSRTKLKFLTQGSLRLISSDQRFTETDRERIEEIMPSSGVFETIDHAQQAMSTLREMLGKRNIWDRLAVGKPITWEALNNDEIGASVVLGYGPDGKRRTIQTQEDAVSLRNEAIEWIMKNR